MQSLVSTANLEELVAESDAPYLGSHSNASSPLKAITVIVQVAATKQLSLRNASQVMTANAEAMGFGGRAMASSFGQPIGPGEAGWGIARLAMKTWDHACWRPSDEWIRAATFDDLKPGRLSNEIWRWYRDDPRRRDQCTREVCNVRD